MLQSEVRHRVNYETVYETQLMLSLKLVTYEARELRIKNILFGGFQMNYSTHAPQTLYEAYLCQKEGFLNKRLSYE